MHHYTYMITCLDNLRYYIGVRSCDVPTGDDPYMGSSDTLDEAIDRRGADRFIKKIIREFDSRQAALEHEIYLHSKYDVKDDPRSYNLCKQTSTGFDTTGTKPSAETLAKLSAAKKRQWADEEYRAKHAAAMKRVMESEEYRAKHAAAMKRVWEDEEYRAKHEAAMKRVMESEDYRAKMSKAAKRRWDDEEYRAKNSEAHSKAVSSPEYRAKKSKAAKRMWEDEEFRAKRAAAMANPETRAKISAAKKGKKQKIVECPHCGKEGGAALMKRWHFNNCKQRSTK